MIALESEALVLISGPGDDEPAGPTVRREVLTGCRLIVSPRGSLMRALVDDVLAEGIDVTIAAEIATNLDSADGAQRDRTRGDAVVVDTVGAACRCTRATDRPGVLPARSRGQPAHPPDRPRNRTDERGPPPTADKPTAGDNADYVGCSRLCV